MPSLTPPPPSLAPLPKLPGPPPPASPTLIPKRDAAEFILPSSDRLSAPAVPPVRSGGLTGVATGTDPTTDGTEEDGGKRPSVAPEPLLPLPVVLVLPLGRGGRPLLLVLPKPLGKLTVAVAAGGDAAGDAIIAAPVPASGVALVAADASPASLTVAVAAAERPLVEPAVVAE